jgi:hypothetical protein
LTKAIVAYLVRAKGAPGEAKGLSKGNSHTIFTDIQGIGDILPQPRRDWWDHTEQAVTRGQIGPLSLRALELTLVGAIRIQVITIHGHHVAPREKSGIWLHRNQGGHTLTRLPKALMIVMILALETGSPLMPRVAETGCIPGQTIVTRAKL